MLRRLLLALVAFGLGTMPVQAADDSPGTPYVVLVGIDKYDDAQIKPRKNAEADAKALYDVFTSKDYLGVTEKNVKLLLGSPDEKRKSEPATRENILKAVQWLEKTAKRDDLVVFAFLGQGVAARGAFGLLRDRLHVQGSCQKCGQQRRS